MLTLLEKFMNNDTTTPNNAAPTENPSTQKTDSKNASTSQTDKNQQGKSSTEKSDDRRESGSEQKSPKAA